MIGDMWLFDAKYIANSILAPNNCMFNPLYGTNITPEGWKNLCREYFGKGPTNSPVIEEESVPGLVCISRGLEI